MPRPPDGGIATKIRWPGFRGGNKHGSRRPAGMLIYFPHRTRLRAPHGRHHENRPPACMDRHVVRGLPRRASARADQRRRDAGRESGIPRRRLPPDGAYRHAGAKRRACRPDHQPSNATLAGSLFPEHEPSKQVADPVYYGGPFSRSALVALVRSETDPGAGSVSVMKNLYLAFRANTIDQIIEATPNRARYYVGYVGWRPGELKGEIDRGVWPFWMPTRKRFSGGTWTACGKNCCSRPAASAPQSRRSPRPPQRLLSALSTSACASP